MGTFLYKQLLTRFRVKAAKIQFEKRKSDFFCIFALQAIKATRTHMDPLVFFVQKITANIFAHGKFY